MIISLCPIRSDRQLAVIRTGDDLTLNDSVVHLATYVEGQNQWIVGTPERIGETWHVQIVLPHGPNPPQATLFPEVIEVPGDGPVELPDHNNAPAADDEMV